MSILIIDDSEDELLLMKAFLKGGGFNDIILATSPVEAFEYLALDDADKEGNGVDLILMDLIMPDTDGIEASRRIKAVKHLEDIPIIMITVKDEVKSLEEALESGVIDYLPKPVNKLELLARVRSVLRLKNEMDRRKRREKKLIETARKLAAANKKLARLSSTDGLTGVANHRYFDQFIQREWKRANREKTSLALIMADIDFFKSFNDTYGHLEGDECLKQVALALNNALKRPVDLLARYGGEEFIAVLPNTDLKGAAALAEEMRSAVEALRIPHKGSSTADHVTVSLGVGAAVPRRDSKPAELISAVDEALYDAKKSGRNRVKFMTGHRLPTSENDKPNPLQTDRK